MWGEVQLGGLVGTSQAENWPLLKLNNEYIWVGGGVRSLYYFCACLKYSVIIKKFNLKSYPLIPCCLPDTL